MWDITSYSPLRISLAGGGTDISPYFENFGSCVVNSAIDRGVTVRYRLDSHPLEVSSRDMVRSQIAGFEHLRMGMPERIIDLFKKYGIEKGRIVINNDVPPGSGLGSSSALVLALLKLIHTIRKEEISKKESAEIAFQIERDDFKITLGRQDPFAISYGGFKYMEMNPDRQDISFFDLNTDFMKKLESSILLVYTGRTRESSRILKSQVTRSEGGEKQTLRNLDKVKELARRMHGAIERESLEDVGQLIQEGWQLKKSLNSRVSNAHVEGIISRSMDNGAIAARLLGGGSQGFVLVLCPERISSLQKEMLRVSRFVIRASFDPLGTRVL